MGGPGWNYSRRQKGKGKVKGKSGGISGKGAKGWGVSDECLQSLFGDGASGSAIVGGSGSVPSTSLPPTPEPVAPKEEDADDSADVPSEFTVSPTPPVVGSESRPAFVLSLGDWLRTNFTYDEIQSMLT